MKHGKRAFHVSSFPRHAMTYTVIGLFRRVISAIPCFQTRKADLFVVFSNRMLRKMMSSGLKKTDGHNCSCSVWLRFARCLPNNVAVSPQTPLITPPEIQVPPLFNPFRALYCTVQYLYPVYIYTLEYSTWYCGSVCILWKPPNHIIPYQALSNRNLKNQPAGQSQLITAPNYFASERKSSIISNHTLSYLR